MRTAAKNLLMLCLWLGPALSWAQVKLPTKVFTPTAKTTVQEQKEPETKFCPYCGSQISRAAKFCPACGASLEG